MMLAMLQQGARKIGQDGEAIGAHGHRRTLASTLFVLE
jgi:hypothetical protein